jgi:hypothetical protein
MLSDALSVLRKLVKFINGIFNFALLMPIYFIGVCFSRILITREKAKPSDKSSNWVKPEKTSDFGKMF